MVRADKHADDDGDLIPYPRFSLTERDRRWSAVRRLMAERDLAAIVTPAHTGHSLDFQANSRYLSHCGGGEGAEITVIFPIEGEVTVGATSADERWPRVQNWVTDIREARRNYGRTAIERLHELGITDHRVGITGLGRGTRSPEGTVLYHTMKDLMEAFPAAEFVDATDLLDEVRLVKSEEEIDFLRRSDELIDEGFAALRRAARVGEYDYVVWAEANAAMMRRGSEATVHFNWVSGKAPTRTLTRPSFRQLERGDIILNELEASWGGWRSQGVQPICVETCDPVYVELLRLQGAVWFQLVEELKPGVTVARLHERCREICEAEAPKSGPAKGATAQLTMHGRGAGDDGPIITGSNMSPHELARSVQANSVVIFKPGVRCEDGSHPINWGDSVVVTDAGGVRLGSREHGMWVATP